jgi:hypothetical protein
MYTLYLYIVNCRILSAFSWNVIGLLWKKRQTNPTHISDPLSEIYEGVIAHGLERPFEANILINLNLLNPRLGACQNNKMSLTT